MGGRDKEGDWLGGGGVELIQLAQVSDWWWALVHMVMKFQVVAPQS
jgi:hypothetical protein